MITPLREWSIPQNAAGVSATRHGAMQALAQSLVGKGHPSAGHVIPVLLAGRIHGEPFCLRDKPVRIAIYDGQAR